MGVECRTDDDPLAGLACQFLGRYAAEALAQFDTGLETTSFIRDGSAWRPVRTRTGPDSFVSTPEFYHRVLQVAPAVLDPAENDEPRLRLLIEPQARRIRSVLSHRHLTPGTLEYRHQFHRLLMAFVTLAPERGGLGIRFDREVGPPRTPSRVLSDRRAACLDFVTFYRLASEISGEPLTPLELFQSESGARMHVAMGILDPETGALRYVVDLQNVDPVSRPRPADVWSEISRRELLAYFYNARGARSSDPVQAESDIDFGLRLSPENYLLLFNKAYYSMQGGRLNEAKDLLQRSIAANPTYSPAYMNLNQLALRMRDQTLADAAWSGYRRSVSKHL